MLASCRNEIVYHLFSGFGHPKKGLNKTLILDLHKMLGKSKPYFPTSRWKLVIYHVRIRKKITKYTNKVIASVTKWWCFQQGSLYYQTQKPCILKAKITQNDPADLHQVSFISFLQIWVPYNLVKLEYFHQPGFPWNSRGSHGTPNQLQHQPWGPKTRVEGAASKFDQI